MRLWSVVALSSQADAIEPQRVGEHGHQAQRHREFLSSAREFSADAHPRYRRSQHRHGALRRAVGARPCSLPHRRRQYVSVDSLQPYGFRARIPNCLSCATSRFAGSSRGSATTEWFPHGKRSVSYATPHKMRRWRDYVVALHGCDGATNRGQRPVCGRCLLSICRGDAAFIRRRRQL